MKLKNWTIRIKTDKSHNLILIELVNNLYNENTYYENIMTSKGVFMW